MGTRRAPSTSDPAAAAGAGVSADTPGGAGVTAGRVASQKGIGRYYDAEGLGASAPGRYLVSWSDGPVEEPDGVSQRPDPSLRSG